MIAGVERVSDVTEFVGFAPREVHLAGRLVQAAAIDESARLLAFDTIRAAHDRGIVVAATGVDDEQQLAALNDIGCRLGVGRPLRRAHTGGLRRLTRREDRRG